MFVQLMPVPEPGVAFLGFCDRATRSDHPLDEYKVNYPLLLANDRDGSGSYGPFWGLR